MNYHHKLAHLIFNIIMLGAMLFGMIAPAAEFGLMVARAQESTEEATEELLDATEAPTEEPTQPATEVPVETQAPVVEVTEEPAVEATETVQPEITDEPTAEATDETGTIPTDEATESPATQEPPTAEPPATSFQDGFEAENTANWTLTPGWALTADDDNMLLRGVMPGANATINSIDWSHLNLRAQLRVQPGNTVEVHLGKTESESYRFVLDATGATALYRGDVLLAQGAAAASENTEAVWRTLTVQAFGPFLTASLDDVLQFTYEDSNPLGTGAVAFVTGADNNGAVDVDNVAVNKLEAPIIATEPAPQPEVTEEAAAEVTEQPELTPEVTEEPAPELVAVPVISADFEGELTGWVASESAVVVAAEEGNHALLMDNGDNLMPADVLDLGDLRLDSRINFVNIADGGLNIVFRSGEGSSYLLTLDAAQTALSRSDASGLTPLMSVPAARAANTWYALRVEAVGGLITVSVDGVAELTYTDENALLTGELALAATGTTSFMIDDVALYQLISADLLASPTPLPLYTLTEETAPKLTDALYQTLSLYEAGDIEGALKIAESTAIKVLDDAHTVEVIVWPEQSNEALMPIVEQNGGLIQLADEKNLTVQIPLLNIIALIASSEVRVVTVPDVAASASDNLSVALDATLQSTPQPHSLGMIGWNNWNLVNIRGAGVKIGVIDNAGTHRQAVIELIKAVAPSATVTAYTATNATSMATQINTARTAGNRIIIITMDLGAHVSPGDGTGSAGSGQGTADGVYQAIQTARNAGRLVIVSAGNNTNGYTSFNYTNASTTLPMTVERGQFLVSVSWNDWNNTAPNIHLQSSITGTNISPATINSPATRADQPGYQLIGTCNAPVGSTCNITLAFSGGNTTGNFVQVQLNSPGTINNITGSTANENAGNIGRPADSAFALAVGAVCSRQSPNYYVPMHDSSHGPIFANGGSGVGPSAISNTRSDYKPDLVSLSHVNSSYFDPVGDPDCDLVDGPTGGFTGTSAAAAHVAGMAALLLSNTSMNAQIANATNPANALQNYLQTHTVDLFSPANDGFGTTPNSPNPTQEDFNAGFDNIYGAGLTTLGSPTYNLSIVANPLGEDSEGTAVFVGQANPGSQQTGEYDEPYIHIAEAIADAADTSDGGPTRIVLLPGEYVSGFAFLNRTGLSMEGYNALPTIWVNDNYNGQAGIEIEGSTGITIESLNFAAANPLDIPLFERPKAIQFYNRPAPNSPPPPPVNVASIIRGSTFSGFIDGAPVTIDGVYGVSVFESTFENINTSLDQLDGAAISIKRAVTNVNPVVIQGNTFRNITGTIKPSNNTDPSGSPTYESIIRIENSSVNLFSNFFVQANAESVIALKNSASDGTNAVNIVSNMFLNNTNLVVHLDPAPEFRFINNTVVNQTSTAGLNNILRRTNTIQGNVPWAMHNNLFYNNPNYQITDHPAAFGGGVECRSLDNGNPDTGARNNWIINTQTSFGSGSTRNCDESLMLGGVPQNNNIIVTTTIDPEEIFIGADPNFLLDANTDPLYYQVIQSADGIDAANVNLIDPLWRDFAENVRSWDGDGDTIDEPDTGAFELVPLTAGPIEVVRLEDLFDQSSDRATAFGIDLRAGVEGGFQPYSFLLRTQPLNFSTDPSDFCLGAGVRIQGNFAYYCPPPHFYTSETLAEVPDNIQFEFYAFDRASDQSDLENAESSTVTIEITPRPDTALNNNGSNPINYQFIAEAGSLFRFRLRPWVRYNNFRFSEQGTQRSNLADYPFSYNTDITITGIGEEGFNPNILDHGGTGVAGVETYIQNRLNNPNPDGTISLQSENGERGFVQFSYQVSDSRTPTGSMTNTIRLEVVGTLPDRGLHDDSSFSFRYGNTASSLNGWLAVTSATNINNTLHQTKKLNDIAGFDFVGESFVLYMQAQANGSLWQLRIDDKAGVNPPLAWVRQTDGSWVAQADGYTCVTRATITTNHISNNGKIPYTVSCDNLRDGEAHSIEIINKQAKALAVDALAILFDSDPLLPGFHEVTEHDLFTELAGWTLINDARASGGKALAAPSATINDIRFRFSGAGFALGTTLERVKVGTSFVGVDYDICITPQIDTVPGTEICQNFDNSRGAGTAPIWNVFRPFYGYSYDPLAAAVDVHEVRIRINELPTNARFIIDSIVVFGEQPTDILTTSNRTFEDDRIGPVVISNGKPNSWALNTANTKASNKSLTSLAKSVVAAGPFIGFQVADDVSLLHWYRQKGSRDSQNILVCVDRGQGEDGIANSCLTYNLRTSPNPLIIREVDFGGWGTSWTDNNVHTVEIFSQVNEVFNFDKVEAFNSTAPLPGGLFEDYVFSASNNTFGFFAGTAGNPLNGGSFQITQNSTTSKASGASVARTTAINEGVLFQMNGTGFTVSFTKDKTAGTVQICWLLNTLTTSVSTVEAGANCRTVNNFVNSNIPLYKVGYTISGLPDGNHTVTVRNLQAKPMQLDAVQIYDDPLPGNILTDAQVRYETSFVNRAAQDTFLYYGAWNSVSGTKASKYSGANYDFIQGAQGASLVFQTQDVDALRIIRTVKAGYASIQVCVDGPATCTDIPATQSSVVITLPDTSLHLISVILTSPGRFELDAIDVFNSLNPLTQGLYEDDTPNLQYDASWTPKTSSAYTQQHTRRAAVANAQMLFYMQGSMLEIGTFVKVANQIQVCFEAGIVTDPNSVDDLCQTFPPAGPFTGRKVYNSGALPGGATFYTVRVRNMVAQELLIDYVNIIDGVNPLSDGRFEESHPQVASGLNGTWANTVSSSASGGAYARTSTEGDFVRFQMQGTGFGIGTFAEKAGSEMEVCYIAGLVSNWDGTGGECVTFQNEASKASMNVLRTITGLPDDSYTVRVTNANDGLLQSVNPPATRITPPSLVIDFVEVYADLPALLTEPGTYNQDGADGGDPFMQLMPADRWGKLTLNTATASNYAAIVDKSNKLSGIYAGPAATFQIEVPANSSSTLILDNLMKDTKNSGQLQICIVGETSAISIDCEMRTTLLTERYQAVTIDNPTGSDFTRTISFSTLTPGYFRIDGFQLIEGTTLGAGLYEDNLIQPGGLIDSVGTGWTTVSNKSFTNGSVRQTNNPDLTTTPSGDYAQFEFQGTGFAIGTHVGKTGSEMQVCYTSGVFDGTWDGTGEQCLDFQNEASAGNTNVLRSVVGLPQNTYTVGVLHLSDGQTNLTNPPKPRPVTNVATLVIDYMLVYNEAQPALLDESGVLNQDAADSGTPFIQLLPAHRWRTITGKAANAATSLNFVSVTDPAGRVVSNTAGTTAAVRVQVTSAEGATLVFNTLAAGTGHSNQLRYCILNGATLVLCNTLTTMPTNPNQVVPLANPGTYTIFFQTLTPGFFRIDNLQLVQGRTLVEGIYDNHFMSADGVIDLNGTWSARQKVAGTFGGEINRTQDVNADLIFRFEGSGFSIINVEDKARLRLEVCIMTEADFIASGEIFTSDAVCRLNSPTITTGKFTQYGLSFYGLEPDTYMARVAVDQAVTSPTTQFFQVDAIVIFGNVTAQGPIGPGIYDNAALESNPAFRFAPAAFWKAVTTKFGPPKGPWQMSEHTASNSGAVVQMFVEGNTLTIYQQFAKSNSTNISACLVVFGTVVNELQCNNFSQSGATRWFTPIAFYGLGTGQHQIIFENKSPKRRFNIDGIQVTP